VPKAVVVDYKLCTGCRICEMACSLRKEGVISASLSRIRVYPFPPGLDVPVLCVQCERAPCVEVCPKKSLVRDLETRAVVVKEDECTGCGICVKACPADAISIHPTRKVAVKCDLCGGKPECVEVCPSGALSYCEVPFDTRTFAKKPEKIAEEIRGFFALPKEV